MWFGLRAISVPVKKTCQTPLWRLWLRWPLITRISWSKMEEWQAVIRRSSFSNDILPLWMMTGSLELSSNQRCDLSLSTWVHVRRLKCTPKLSNLRFLSRQIPLLPPILTSPHFHVWVSHLLRWNVLRIIKAAGAEKVLQSLPTYSWQPRWHIWHPAWPRHCWLCIRSGPLGFAWCL